jgi:hypothetical protein
MSAAILRPVCRRLIYAICDPRALRSTIAGDAYNVTPCAPLWFYGWLADGAGLKFLLASVGRYR